MDEKELRGVDTKMVGQVKTRVRRLSIWFLVVSAIIVMSSVSYASDKAPYTTMNTSVEPMLAGIRAVQFGGDSVFVYFRGFDIPHPKMVSEPGSSKLVLQWDGIRFARNTDKRDWWGDYDWDVLKLEMDKRETWWKQYELPLLSRVNAEPVSPDSVRLSFTTGKAMTLERIEGIAGSDQQTVVLKTYEPPKVNVPERKVVKTYAKGDPMGIKNPVTLQLRDTDVKSVFRMLADIQKLNLLLDPSVPDMTITVSFTSAPYNEVFSYLLRMTDLSYSIVGSTLVVGKLESLGKTLGKEIVRGYNLSYAIDDAGVLQGDLTAALTGLVSLSKPPVIDQRNRTLYVTATPEQHIEVAKLLEKLDRPGRQIMIQAKIIEVNDDAKQELETLMSAVYDQWLINFTGGALNAGYNYTNTAFKLAEVKLPIAGRPTGDESTWTDVPMDAGLKFLSAGLSALESNGKGKVLAHPSVIAIDGKTANVALTHNYKYVSGVDTNGNVTFSEVNAGPTLTFTPVIGRNGMITLKVNIKTGSIINFRRAGNGAEAPETTSRAVETIVRVRNAEPFVVGGLYQETRSKNRSRIPVLGYIPLLGDLFTQRNDKHTKSEVAMIVVPYILDIPDSTIPSFDLQKISLTQ